jgi:hypothetical protein
MDDLLLLAERCEQATKPDREIDRAIQDWWFPLIGGPSREHAAYPAYDFTASLDAAMTLAPEGRTIINIAEDGITTAIVCGTQGCAPTPALALCAAALKARSSINEGQQS